MDRPGSLMSHKRQSLVYDRQTLKNISKTVPRSESRCSALDLVTYRSCDQMFAADSLQSELETSNIRQPAKQNKMPNIQQQLNGAPQTDLNVNAPPFTPKWNRFRPQSWTHDVWFDGFDCPDGVTSPQSEPWPPTLTEQFANARETQPAAQATALPTELHELHVVEVPKLCDGSANEEPNSTTTHTGQYTPPPQLRRPKTPTSTTSDSTRSVWSTPHYTGVPMQFADAPEDLPPNLPPSQLRRPKSKTPELAEAASPQLRRPKCATPSECHAPPSYQSAEMANAITRARFHDFMMLVMNESRVRSTNFVDDDLY